MGDPIRWTGAPEIRPRRPGITPEQDAQMVELLPTASSIREIADLVGLSSQIVSRRMAPFVAIMRLQGTLPPCECGRERFHRNGCSIVSAKRTCPYPGSRVEDRPGLFARRELVIAMLVAGERWADIADALGIRSKSACKYMRHLTPDQRAAREAAVAARGQTRQRRAKPQPAGDTPGEEPGPDRWRWLLPAAYSLAAAGDILTIGEFA